MKDLILRTRLEALKQNLGQVEKAVDSVRENRIELLKLLEPLNVQEQIKQLNTAISKIKIANILAGGLDSTEDSEGILDNLDKAQKALEGVKDKLEEAQKASGAERLQTFNKQMQENAFSSGLGPIFKNEAKVLTSDLQEIYSIRDEAENAYNNGDMAAAENLLQKAWSQYTERIRKSQPVFKEYIDFLGGLALRDTYVDAGAYLIADKLIQSWAETIGAQWDSLTIPAREEPIGMGLARMIRLGFPEWTIWALPLAAHGFWYVLKDHYSWKNYIEHHSLDSLPKDYLQHYLADAFATYSMGPAYACAAILLRFNPSSHYTDHDEQPPSTKRAYVVFSMLNKMHEASGTNGAYDYQDILERLKSEWDAALQQVKFLSPDSVLQDSDEQQLDDLVNYFWTFLDISIGVGYPYSSWKNMQLAGWPEQLLKNEWDTINSIGLADLRNVLNAAWLCRLDHLDKTEEIALAALRLWSIIVGRQSESGAASPGGANISSRSSKRG